MFNHLDACKTLTRMCINCDWLNVKSLANEVLIAIGFVDLKVMGNTI